MVLSGRHYVPHSRSYTHVLRPVFEDYIISCQADVISPPRSYDLAPLYYYLWAAVKDKFYADKPETIDALRNNTSIRETIGDVQLDNVLKNWTDRVVYFMASRGSHLNEIIFHYQPEELYFQIEKEI